MAQTSRSNPAIGGAVPTQWNRTMIVEAKVMLGAESEKQQDHRLMQLMHNLSGKLNRTVLIHPMLDLPSSLPNRRIAADIESRASEVELLQKFLVDGEHQGEPYSLEVTVILEDKLSPTADVGATIGQAVEVDIGHPVRKAIRDKARKYGRIEIPFVIAIWAKLPYHLSFGSNDDLVTLYGDKVWQGPDYSDLREVIKPNGVFTLAGKDGTRVYSDISAVLFCHPYNTDSSKIYIHHNLFTKRPVGMNIFKGVPQCSIDLATGKAHWLEQ